MRRRRSITFLSFLAIGVLALSAVPGAAQGSPSSPWRRTTGVTEFPVPTPNSRPYQIVAGPDGNLWFTESDASKIGKITPGGSITEYKLAAGTVPYGITVGPDGNIWFTERLGNAIAKMDTSGNLLAEYFLPTLEAQPWHITPGPDGKLWFTEENVDLIGAITVGGLISEFPTNSCCFPTQITTGEDGRLWFTEELPGQIGAMSTDGEVEYFTPPRGELTYGITTGPDGNVWFTALTGTYKLGNIDTGGKITEVLAPAVFTGIAGVTTGPDGNLWYTMNDTGRVGGVTPSGGRLGTFRAGSYPIGITAGPDGNIWFTESQSNAIGRLELGS
jgi:virginiamycin B lyase